MPDHDDDRAAALTTARPDRRPLSHPDVLLVLAVTIAYANALAGPFQWDDFAVIVHNPRVHGLRAWAAALPTGIRPVLALTYTLGWIASPSPVGFHLVNVALHAANAVLVRRLAALVVAPGAALAAAAVFALHPVQTEAVAYVSGRSSSLMACGYLAGLLLWWRAHRRLALAAFVLALGAKETAVTWPAAVVLLEVARGHGLPAALRRSAPAWAVGAVGLALVASSARYRDLLHFSLGLRGPLENLPSQVAAVGYLVSRLLVPWRLTIDPGLAPAPGWTPALAAGGVAIVLATACAVAGVRRRPLASLAVLWLVLHLLPTNSVIARADVVSERQLYLASIGPFVLAGAAVAGCAARRPSPLAVGVPLVLVLGVLTTMRNRDYRSEVALWSAAVRVDAGNARAHNNLGFAWQRAGCPADARAAYEEALRLRPDYPKARANLAALGPASEDAVCPTPGR